MTPLVFAAGLALLSGRVSAATTGDGAVFQPAELPVRALMINFPPEPALAEFLEFIRNDLPREGVNHLILQIDYGYQFKSRPELAGDVSEASVKAVVAACRESGVKVIQLVNCLGHQSWAKTTHRLLTVYPEFDETPGLHPDNEGIYCRSYCPNHPEVHCVMFDVLEEIARVFEADALHVGMDEVFLLAEDSCPRCHGADPAEVFAQEVRKLHGFLASRDVRMWLWGDRLLDGRTAGLGKWEASMNNTHRAITMIPKDIVICDWHYEGAPPTAAWFAMHGFEVVLCSWNKPAVAVAHANQIVGLRAENAGSLIGSRLLGVMATHWGRPDRFVPAYRATLRGASTDVPTAPSFVALFERVRELRVEFETKTTSSGPVEK